MSLTAGFRAVALTCLLACGGRPEGQVALDGRSLDGGLDADGQGGPRPDALLSISCLTGWPEPATTTPADSLVVVPSVVWRTEATFIAYDVQRVVEFGAGFALASLQRIQLFDWGGQDAGSVPGAASDLVRGPVGDPAGALYFSGHGLYSLSPSGSSNWLRLQGLSSMSAPIADNAGRVYAVGDDSRLYALGGDSGGTAFSAAGVGPPSDVTWLVGIGETVFAPGASGQGIAFNRDGALLGGLRLGDGSPLEIAVAGSQIGLVTVQRHALGSRVVVLDKCGAEKWRAEGDPYMSPRLVGYGDDLVVYTSAGGLSREVSVFSAAGERVAGPSDVGYPYLIGGDGTIYSVRCPAAGPAELVASDRTLAAKFTLPLDDWCPTAATMSDTGLLVLVGEAEGHSRLIGVQTPSPGVARTSWPGVHGNSRANHWVSN